MNRLSSIIGAAFALSVLQSAPLIPITFDGERKPAQPAGKAVVLFETRQLRRAREREKPIAQPTPRGRRRK